jgi:hypothetical protein
MEQEEIEREILKAYQMGKEIEAQKQRMWRVLLAVAFVAMVVLNIVLRL